jgi:hypothetical protein
VLINSAGITGASGQKTGNVDYESWAHVFNVNTIVSPRLLRVGIEWASPRSGQSRPRGGRPRIGKEVRDLIRRMSIESPLWGAPNTMSCSNWASISRSPRFRSIIARPFGMRRIGS